MQLSSLLKKSVKANPYLEGNFAPVLTESNLFDLPVSGKIPQDLSGSLIRIGPNPVAESDPSKYHWFMGNGMVHGIELSEGRASSYRNRFVVDSQVSKVLEKPALGGPKRFHDKVNTNVISVAGKPYAVVEAGALPVELDKKLNSIARSDFGGTLKGGFSAHPRRDPVTGELHAITYEPQHKKVDYVVVDHDGTARNVAEISLSHSPMVHDTALTKSFVVVLDLPVSFDLGMVITGTFPYRWNDKVTPRIGLVPRSGSHATLRWFDAPSCFVFHILNAFEADGQVIIDVVKHPRAFDENRNGPREGATTLVRWVLDLTTDRLSETVLSDKPVEFPRLNDAYTGQPYRFGYTSLYKNGLEFGPIHKHDLVTQRTETHDFGVGQMSGEPVFVPRAGSGNEDGGWLLTMVYDANTDKSALHIIDAERFTDPSVAIIQLPVRVPFGFHGNWFPAI